MADNTIGVLANLELGCYNTVTLFPPVLKKSRFTEPEDFY
jgi:hypothetical protein